MSHIWDMILEMLSMPFTYLVDSHKRVFCLYLFSSFLLGLFVYKRLAPKVSFSKYFFNKDIWLGQSAQTDYSLIFFNSIIKVLLIAPFLGLVVSLVHSTQSGLTALFGQLTIQLSQVQWAFFYTVSLLLVNDFCSFFIHYLMHHYSFLWAFHKVHHSAEKLNPFTQYRIHPVELLINNARGIMVKGLVTGVFMFLAQDDISLLTIIGVNIFDFFFMLFGANLRHSHVPLKYFKALEYLIISPYQHQIHHSNNPKEFNTNMGSRLAIWDWLFGTLRLSTQVKKIRFGLGLNDDKNYRTFKQNLLSPLRFRRFH